MFLSDADLETLTGLKQPAAQRRWLTREKINFRIRADGHNTVLRSDLESQPVVPTRPRFDLVRQAR